MRKQVDYEDICITNERDIEFCLFQSIEAQISKTFKYLPYFEGFCRVFCFRCVESIQINEYDGRCRTK